MRIRSTKPEFWRSERIASVNWDARLVLKGLESYVDDNGVGRDDIALIVSDVFPRDLVASPPVTLARVSEAINRLHLAGLLWRYEADNTPLLFVSFWDSLQRIDKPGRGRFPRPDGTTEYKDSDIRESVASPPEVVAPGAVEQWSSGAVEELPSAPAAPKRIQHTYPDDFEVFWDKYPKKRGKDAALKAWKSASRRAPLSEIIAGAVAYAKLPRRVAKPEYTMDPATWLNGGHWADEPDAAPASSQRYFGKPGERRSMV